MMIVPAAIGLRITAVAANSQIFVVGLAISSTIAGFVHLVRALLNAVVEPHTIATLNTVICLVETLVGFAGAPWLGWLLSKGIRIGGFWAGLPFMACAAVAYISVGFIFAYRLEHSKTPA